MNKYARYFEIALMTGILSFPALAETGHQAGFVLDVSGQWEMSHGNETLKLTKGQAVMDGATVSPLSDGARLTLVMLDGERIMCPTDKRCAEPLGMRKDESSAVSRLLHAVSSLFSNPERYATTMSRGDELKEAVISLDNGNASVAPLFEVMPPGRYALTLEPITEAATIEVFAVVDWSPNAADLARVSDVEPGLYRAVLESEADAWILLVPTEGYPAASAMFARARELSAKWADVPPASVRTFRRAALEAILEETASERR